MTTKPIIYASFDVDAQKTFTPLCPDELPIPDGHSIVDELNRQAELASFRIGSRCAHPEKADWVAESADDVMQPVAGDNVDIKWPRHGVVGTKGFSLLDGLPHPVTGYDFMASKGLDSDCHPYGACYHDLAETRSTGVIEFLHYHDVTDVIVGGLALDYCVLTTVRQLVRAGFNVVLNRNACRGVGEETSTDALKEMADLGVLLAKNADIIKRLMEK